MNPLKLSMYQKSSQPKIEMCQLEEIDKADIICLMNSPLVRRQMPLAKGLFDEAAYNAFIASKRQLWVQYGYGPWAFLVDGKFAGWGGLQFEEGDPDLALVLHPDYWGIGKVIYERIIEYAFEKLGLKYVTALLPLSRKHQKVLLRLHFKQEGALEINGETFTRFRLLASDVQKRRENF